MNQNALELRSVSHRYGDKLALNDVNLTIAGGQFVALLGPNGAGKTTLFSILTRLLRPDGGSVTLFGQDLIRRPGDVLSQIGVVFQQSTLDLDLTVDQNLAFHGSVQGMSPKQVRQRTLEELTRFALDDLRDKKVRQLNGGHRRRVELARALLHQPRLLLLDEASAGLDLESRTRLYQHVKDLVTGDGMSVLWTTHVVEELQPEDTAVLLQAGTVQGSGALGNLVQDAGVADTRSLILGLSGSRP